MLEGGKGKDVLEADQEMMYSKEGRWRRAPRRIGR